jgi:hypothetical protein
MNPDIANLALEAARWEFAGYVGAGLVLLGIIVGSIGLVTELPRAKVLAVLGLALLVGGLVVEILAQVNASSKNGRVIAALESQASEALASAAKLGVTVDNLHAFVEAKEKQGARAFEELKAVIAAEEARNADVIAELSRNREALEAARAEATASAESTRRLLADIAAESKRQAEARRDTEKRLGDRMLTDDQVSAITSALSSFKGQEYGFVTPAAKGREAMNLLRRMQVALQGAGWVNKAPLAFSASGSKGVTVVARANSDGRTRAAAGRLASVLNASGIGAKLSVETEGQRIKTPQELSKKNEIEIRVGPKP